MKKISWGLIIISMSYFIITFPYARHYNDYSSKSEYPPELNSNTETKYIQEHHRRIEHLEREVERTQEEVWAIRERLSLMLQILMFGIIYYGSNQIFNSKNKNPENIDNDKVLSL